MIELSNDLKKKWQVSLNQTFPLECFRKQLQLLNKMVEDFCLQILSLGFSFYKVRVAVDKALSYTIQ